MKMFHSKAKYGLVLMLVLSLVLQIAGPIVSQVYANEGIEEVGDGEVNQEVVASQDEGLLEDSQDEKLVKESEEIESQKATDQSLEPEDVEQLAKDKQKPANSDQEEKAQNIEVLKRNQENIINIRPLDAGGGKDLGNIAGFSYTENIYVGGSKEPIKDGDVIELEDLTLLTYRVDFEIPDGYKFNSKDYLNFDLKSLAGIKGININDKDINGRVIFDIANEKIDAAGYKVEGNNLKVTFDHGETINGKRGRKAFVELGFDIKETSEEVEVIEKIELKGKEPKTFGLLSRKRTV